MKYYTFQLSTGYAESASIGSVLISNEKYFESVTDALYHFGLAVQKSLEQLIIYHNNDVNTREEKGYIKNRDCCQATLLANSTKVFCAKCFSPIRTKEVIVTPEQVNQEVEKMIRLTNDEYGYDLTEELARYGWSVGYCAHEQQENKVFTLVDVHTFSWHPKLKEGKTPGGMEWFEYEMKLVKKVFPKWENTD